MSEIQPSRSAAAGSLANLTYRLGGVALGLAVASMLTRGLGTDGYGLLALATGLGTMLAQLVDYGFSQTAVRMIASGEHDPYRVTVACVAVRAVLGAVAGGLLVLYAVLFLEAPERSMVALAGALVPVASGGAMASLLQANLRISLLGAIVFWRSVLWTIAVALLMQVGASPLAVLVGLGVFDVATNVIVARTALTRRERGYQWLRVEASTLVRQSAGVGLMGVGTIIYYKADSALVYRYAGANQAGLYAAAYRFVDVAQLLPSVLVLPLVPLVVKAHAESSPATSRRLATQALVLGMTFAVPFAATMPFVAERLVRLLFGADFADASPLAAVLGLSFVGMTMGWVGTALAVALNVANRLWLLTWGCAASSVLGAILLVPAHGAIAAAWISVGVEFVVGIGTMVVAFRRLGARVPLAGLARVMLLSLVVGVSQFLTRCQSLVVSLMAATAMFMCGVLLFGLLPTSVRQLARTQWEKLQPERRKQQPPSDAE